MEARSTGPRLGLVALCAALCLFTSRSLDAQFAPYGYPAQPMMVGPGQMAGGPIPAGAVPAGIIQPFIQGMPARAAIPAGMGHGSVPAQFASGTGSDAIPSMSPDSVALGRGAASESSNYDAPGQVGNSENFIVMCRDPKLAQTVSKEAERLRRELAMHWLGYELPPWSRRCPIQVTAGARLGAGGETRFALYNGNVGDWQMSVQGTPERILDSVLPHEITHTILASHFAPLNVHVPRWADEGACTTVEHDSEQNKHKAMLVDFMKSGRAMSFNRMFSLKDYPKDILPLYAQGHSVVEFLIAQGGPQLFVKFLHQGMQTQHWERAVRDHYGYNTLGELQGKWNSWIVAGRGDVQQFAGRPDRISQPESDAVQLASSAGNDRNRLVEGASVSLAGFASSPKQTPSNDSDDGFYRKRLEANLRDITRTHSSTEALKVLR